MTESKESRVVRVNARISPSLNEWLDKRSQEVGISKSGLIAMAVENYRKETEVVDMLPKLMAKLEELGIDMNELRQ